METSTLRWILIIIGLIVVASIFFFGNPERKPRPKASRRRKDELALRREPTLEGVGSEAEAVVAEPDDGEEGGQGELDIGMPQSAGETDSKPASPEPARPPGPAPDKIVSLFLLARDNHIVTGAELLQAAVSTGMEFGDMNIFHRVAEGTDQSVFSMANAAKPGNFERDEWNTFETTGVVLFMTLPGPVQALDGWDSMLATARRMSEILNAELLDDERNSFTRQREAQLREEMRDYDRRMS